MEGRREFYIRQSFELEGWERYCDAVPLPFRSGCLLVESKVASAGMKDEKDCSKQ